MEKPSFANVLIHCYMAVKIEKKQRHNKSEIYKLRNLIPSVSSFILLFFFRSAELNVVEYLC